MPETGNRSRVFVAALFAVAILSGCAPSLPAAFRLNLEGRDPAKINRQQDEALRQTLATLFGTPDAPELPEGVALDMQRLKAAAGPIGSDESGRSWGLYRKHCVACHGLSGDGAGPNAAVLTPYPRDYRNGVFKFTSTAAGAKPVRADLERTLVRGIPGTAMPSFAKLDAAEREALIEYVTYLSIRGETELYLLDLVVDQDEYPVRALDVAGDSAVPTFGRWQSAEQFAVAPPPAPADDADSLAASMARGKDLYATKDAQCVKCHGENGRGDGEQSADLLDDWNKKKKGITPEQTAALARLYTLPLQPLKARDFSEGIYLGGDRPIDLYWRIYVGIKGTPMPAAGPAGGNAGALKPEQIWDVVNYVRSLSPRR